MMKQTIFLFSLIALFGVSLATTCSEEQYCSQERNISSNQCIQFTVGQGTGCAWMCSYCASQLGTNNYYFPDSVCTYQQGTGCVGNPVAGHIYSCCAI